MKMLRLLLIFSLSSLANATIVQPNPAYPGFNFPASSTALLMLGQISDPAMTSSALRPTAMGDALGAVNLGTGTDLFGVGFNTSTGSFDEWWVRYTLDPASTYAYSLDSDPVIHSFNVTGELWVSFINGVVDVHADRMSGPWGGYLGPLDTASLQPGLPLIQSFADTFGNPFACDPADGGCDYSSQLNLSFLGLQWNGLSYELTVTPLGNDLLFHEYAYEDGWQEYNLVLASVPVPAAAWLFGSALIGLATFKRKCWSR